MPGITRSLGAFGLVALPLFACLTRESPILPLVRDLDGQVLDPLATAASAYVFLFVDPECPISNAFSPEIQRLAEEYTRQGVEFELVYADPRRSQEEIRRHARDFGLRLPVLLDFEHALVTRAGVTSTPEAAVFRPCGERVYRGRIDDRFFDFGRQRPQPTQHDLRDALEALLAGRDPEVGETPVVGCFIPDLPTAVRKPR